MRIENLYEGQIVKNYKELCNLLDIEPKAPNNTNGRKSQYKEFDRYFEYEKQGYKYIIKKIYNTPMEKQEKKGNNTIFSDDIELLILNMLNNSKDDTLTIARGQLYKALSMCNENYLIGRSNMTKLSEIIELPKDSIYEFYDYNSTKLRDTIERNLRRLRSKALIMWKMTTTIATTEIELEYNEFGDPIYDKDSRSIRYKINTIHRLADKYEEKIILKYEKQAMDEMGFETQQDIFIRGKWKIFKSNVENKLKENGTNIDYYYDTYTITFNNEDVKNHIKKINRSEMINIKRSINKNMIESVDKATLKRHNKAMELLGIEYDEYKNKKIERQSKDTYTSEQHELTMALIDINAKSLKDEIYNTNINFSKLNVINSSIHSDEFHKNIPF